MELVYRPDGKPDQEKRWPLDLGKLRTMETEAIEKLSGLKYGSEFKMGLLKQGALERRVMLYTLQRREHPTLRFSDVDFADDECFIDFDRDELAQIRQAAEDADLDEATRAQALAALDAQLAQAPEAPGKATSSSSAADTPSP